MPVTSKTFARTTIALLLVGLLTLLGIVATSLWLLNRTNRLADNLVEVQQVRRAALAAVSVVQDAEAGQRGYLMTDEERYLEPYVAARSRLEEQVRILRERVRTRPEYMAAASGIEESIVAKLAELQQTVDLARAGRKDAAMAIVRTDLGKNLMADIRRQRDALIDSIDARLAESAAGMRYSAMALEIVLVAGGVIILFVVGGSTWVAARYTSELVRARAEVDAMNASLEERVRDRTADLARANEEIQRFAYIVSHDLRAPLVNVMGFTSELETGLAAVSTYLDALPPKEADLALPEARLAAEVDMPEAIAFIRSSTGKMDGLISAILKLSREGGRVLAQQHVDMGELMEVAAGAVKHRLDEAGGAIDVVAPIPDIVSDRLALEQVFGNLVDNASKYLDPRRPGKIAIRGAESRNGLVYEVEDNGRGIAQQDRERIFELFRRAGAQDQPGEGIGLSHVRALVRRLGGDIELDSKLGSGTTFRVKLPKHMPLAGENM